MSDEDNVIDDTLNVTADDTQDTVSDTDTNDTDNQGSVEETPEERIARLEQLNTKLFIRAKEAEGYKLVNGKWVKKETPPSPAAKPPVVQSQVKQEFDLEDVAVLVSKVSHREDREVVKKYAKLEGKTLEESISDPIVQGILKQKAEERKSAEVAHTGGGKRTTVKATEEQIVNKARTTDYSNLDPEALAQASFNQKLKK